MKSIRIMLLGIGLLLFGILCELLSLNRIIGQFWSFYLPITAAAAGLVCLISALIGVWGDE